MKELAEILKTTPVSSLINAKPMKKKNFICLDEGDTIRNALITYITHDIESIPIRKFQDKKESEEIDVGIPFNYECELSSDDFVGIVSLVNLLKFIFSADCGIPIHDILNYPLNNLTQESYLIQKIEFVKPEMSLIHVLLNVWGGICNPTTKHIDCKHLLTMTQSGKYDVITPLDFLRHLLFVNPATNKCLKNSQAAEIENGLEVDENSIVSWEQEINVAVSLIIQGDPSFLVAVVNKETGTLEASVSFSDLLPLNVSLLDESVSMIRRKGISVHSYLHTLQESSPTKATIDPILLYSHFTIYDLIEKLTRLRIHYLWRVTPDAKKKPIGAVGVNDILRYLCFMFRPFLHEKLPKGQLTIQS